MDPAQPRDSLFSQPLHGCWSCGFTEGLLSVEHISAAEREGGGEGVGEGAPGEGRLGRKPT